jgi:hypothetical protein
MDSKRCSHRHPFSSLHYPPTIDPKKQSYRHTNTNNKQQTTTTDSNSTQQSEKGKKKKNLWGCVSLSILID